MRSRRLYSCFPYFTIDENFEYIKSQHTFGHSEMERMNRLTKNGIMRSPDKVRLLIYESCFTCEAYKKPFGKALKLLTLNIIHSNICGPMNGKACHNTYFITPVDD